MRVAPVVAAERTDRDRSWPLASGDHVLFAVNPYDPPEDWLAARVLWCDDGYAAALVEREVVVIGDPMAGVKSHRVLHRELVDAVRIRASAPTREALGGIGRGLEARLRPTLDALEGARTIHDTARDRWRSAVDRLVAPTIVTISTPRAP